MLTSRKLTYCIVFVAAICLLALGVRNSLAQGNTLKPKASPRAIIEGVNKYNDQIVRDNHTDATSCVLPHVPLIPFPVSIDALQPQSPAIPPLLLSQSTSCSRAPPHRLT